MLCYHVVAMQAKGNLHSRLVSSYRALREAADGLSRLQIAIIATLVALLALGGVLSYVRSRPRPVEVSDRGGRGSTSVKRKLTVHVAGAVARPGLYRLDEGKRVDDALTAAGGALQDGMLDDVNLASPLKDGEKVMVTRRNTAPTTPAEAGPEAVSSTVNINTAGAAELEKLPGVGPSLASRIIDYRKRNGSFSSVEELDNIEGIGPRKLESLKGQVTL